MNLIESIESLKKKTDEYGNAWHGIKLSVGVDLSGVSSKTNAVVGAVTTGIDAVEKILQSFALLAQLMVDVSDVWKSALSGIVDASSNLLSDEGNVHYISLPPLVLVSEKELDPYVRQYLKDYRQPLPYTNPVSGQQISGLYMYPGPDLFPYYKIVKDSILDEGDINAPRFDDSYFAAATLIVELGSSISNLFAIKTLLGGLNGALPIFSPIINNTFKIQALQADKDICVKFDSDTVIRRAMEAVGEGQSLTHYSYSLYKADRREVVNYGSLVSDGPLNELLASGWKYVDSGPKRGMPYYYRAVVSLDNIPIAFSNTAVGFVDSTLDKMPLASTPPDWQKVGLLSSVFGADLLNQALSALDGVIQMIGSILKGGASLLKEQIDRVIAILQEVKNKINYVAYIINSVINALKKLSSLSIHSLFYTGGDGSYYDLINHYHDVLVVSPPKIDTESARKIVYMATLVAPSTTMKNLEQIMSLLSTSVSQTKELSNKTMAEADKNIKQFQEWLNQYSDIYIQPTTTSIVSFTADTY